MKVISVVSQKGGCAKTTTVVNVSYYLAKQGYKVLAIDLDPQGHLARGFGFLIEDQKQNLIRVINGERSIEDIRVNRYGVDIWPSTSEMYHFEVEFVGTIGADLLLKKLLEKHAQSYDYIIIDNQPSHSLTVINALAASDWYLVPVFPETWGMDGLHQIQKTVRDLHRFEMNTRIDLLGLFMANVESRTNAAQFVRDVLEEIYPKDKLIDVVIPKTIAVAEAIIASTPLAELHPHSPASLAYRDLTEYIIAKIERSDSGVSETEAGLV